MALGIYCELNRHSVAIAGAKAAIGSYYKNETTFGRHGRVNRLKKLFVELHLSLKSGHINCETNHSTLCTKLSVTIQ